MAKESRQTKPFPVPLTGVEEMQNQADIDTVSDTNGIIYFFKESYQRMFGKKLIDANESSNNHVYAIHQALNGFGMYGYYVETSRKLYYHLCSNPPDFRIHFIQLQS
jgi:hypothetical protein